MTNEEIILKAKEKIRLRGLSPDPEIEYLTGIRVLARYYDNPQIMSRNEIVRFLESIDNLRDRAIFETIYGSGIRLSEAAHLRVQDIDSEGMRLFVYQGKCNKDRYPLA